MTWTIDALLDSIGGQYGSFAFDSNGAPHCVYVIPYSPYGVYYMNKMGGVWSTPVQIHSTGWYADIAIASDDTLHVAIAEPKPSTASTVTVWHYTNSGGGWSYTSIFTWTSGQTNPPTYDYLAWPLGVAICLSPTDDTPHILFTYYTKLKVVVTEPRGYGYVYHWDGSTNNLLYSDSLSSVLSDPEEWIYGHVWPHSIWCDFSGTPHWCYSVLRNKHIYTPSNRWQVQYSKLYLDSSLFLSSTVDGITYIANSIYVDPSDDLHWSYYSLPAYGGGTSPTTYYVLNSTGEAVGGGMNGTVIATSAGEPHLAYCDGAQTTNYHAVKVGAAWSIETIATSYWTYCTVIGINASGELGAYFTFDDVDYNDYMYFAYPGGAKPWWFLI